MEKKYSNEISVGTDLFELLQHGEKIYCGDCRCGILRKMNDFIPQEKAISFQCDNCGGIYRYDPVNIIIT